MSRKKASDSVCPAIGEFDARVLVVDGPLPLSELRSLPLTREVCSFRAWLADDGCEMVLATGRGKWLFLWVVDIERQTVRRWVSVRTPTHLECLSVSQDGDRLWVAGSDGTFEISRRDWRLGRWYAHDDLVQDVDRDGYTVLPGTSYLWLDGMFQPVVLDLESGSVKHPPDSRAVSISWLQPVLTPGGTLAVASGDERPRLYRADGAPVAGAELPPERWVWSQAVAPDGEGFLQLTVLGVRQKGPNTLRLTWLKKSVLEAYRVAARMEIADVPDEYFHRVATAFDLGLSFVLTEVRGRKLVLALSLRGDKIHELYRFRVPTTAHLVQDRESWSVVVYWIAEGGVQALPLGPEPPPAACVPGDSLLMRKPMSNPPWEPGEWDLEDPLARGLLAAIEAADQARRDGDLAAALAAVDQPLVWAAAEIQSLARLAVVVLESPARTAAERFRKQLVLSHFHCLRHGQGAFARKLEVPGLSWEAEELDRIAERGRAWLTR